MRSAPEFDLNESEPFVIVDDQVDLDFFFGAPKKEIPVLQEVVFGLDRLGDDEVFKQMPRLSGGQQRAHFLMRLDSDAQACV